MKKYTRIKIINGREYAYEITPYYDPKTKNTRQKSKYLGAVQSDGSIRKVRQKLPRNSFSYGQFIPALHVISELKVDEILTRTFGEARTKLLLALAMNRALRPVAFHNVRNWYEGTILVKEYGDLPLSSQNISKVLSATGQSSAPYEFCKSFTRSRPSADTLVYDITSLSSYSDLISLLEYGYNRDGLSLPQVNLSMVLDKERGIPVLFDVYPGSVPDVSTFKNTLTKLGDCGAKSFRLVLDRGFFSSDNVMDMLDAELDFVIPAKASLKEVKNLISKNHTKKEDPSFLRLYQDRTLFVKDVTVRIKSDEKEKDVPAYLYYDLRRAQEQKDAFYKALRRCVEQIEEARPRSWQKPAKVVGGIAKKLVTFIRWKKMDGNRISVTLKKKAISQRVNKMGFTVLLYNGDHTWDGALTLYREKDIIEKIFQVLKRDLEAMPMNVQSTETMKGFVFVTFLALIIRFRLIRMLKDAGLGRKWSVDKFLLEMEKLSKVEMENGEMFTTEITKKQRELMEALGLTCA